MNDVSSVYIGEYLSIYHFLILSFLMFGVGLFGMLRRKNILMLFFASEIMLNALNVGFTAISAMFFDINGQMFALFIIAIAASEVAIGLGLVLMWWRKCRGGEKKSLSIDDLTIMKG